MQRANASLWGHLSCLYTTLESQEQQDRLEEAISLHQRGFYTEAASTLIQHFPHYGQVPVLAISLSDIYESSGLAEKRTEVLENVARQAINWRHKAVGNVELLVKMLLANASMISRGTMRQSMDDAVRVRDTLRGLTKSTLARVTNIEVRNTCCKRTGSHTYQLQARCFLECRQTIITVKENSNWLKDPIGGNLCLGTNELVDEVEQLYLHFRNQNALTVAVRLALVSLNNEAKREFWTNELADLCTRLKKTSDPSSIHLALVVDAFVLQRLEGSSSREERYRRLEEELKKWMALSGLRSQHMDWILQQVSATASVPEAPLSRYDLCLRLADQAHAISNYQWERQQLYAAGSACRTAMKETLQSKSLSEVRGSYRYLRCRLASLELIFTRSAFLLGETLVKFLNVFDDLEQAEYITLIERLFTCFPKLDVPKTNAALFSQAGLCANALGNTSKGQFLYSKAEDWKWQLPIAEHRVVDEKFVAMKAIKLNPGENFAALLHSHDEEQRVRDCMEYLIQWMQADIKAGWLELSKLRESLPVTVTFNSEESASASGAKLEDPRLPDLLFAHLFNFSMSENLPATQSQWDTKINPLKDWLLTELPVHMTEQINSRHTVLTLLFLWRFKSLRDQAIRIQRETGEIDDPTALALYSAHVMYKDVQGYMHGSEDSIQDEFTMKAISALSHSKSAVQKGQLTAAMLDDYNVVGEKVCRRYLNHGRLSALYNELFQRALMMERRDHLFTKFRNVPVMSNDLSRTLLLLEEADQHYIALRQASASLLPKRRLGSEEFDSQYALTQHLPQSAVYRLAIRATLANYMRAQAAEAKELGGHGPRDRLGSTQDCLAKVLTWVERSKARILTQTLGLHGQLPTRLLVSSAEDSVSEQKLAKESDLINDLLATHPDDLVAQWKASKALRQYQESLRKDESLSEIMALRDGVPVSVRQTADLLRRLDDRVIIVSYFEVENHPASDLWMAIYSSGRDPIVLPTIRMALVKGWVSVSFRNRNQIPLANPVLSWNNLALHSQLIQPLEYLTCPGDHVVFCPFQDLHLIPFHALLLGDKLLIKRNPVSYCPSLSVLYQLHNTWECSSQDAEAHVSLIHVLPNDKDRIDTFYSDLASSLKSSALTGTFVPTDKAIDSLQDATLFCFHGHGDYQDQDTAKKPRHPFEQALDLGRRGKNPDIPGDYGAKAKLTAQRVFDVSLQPGALAMLVACESGKARVSDTDEHLGLNTAFYHAGATSVVSTLWKIGKEDGNAFVRAFFRHLRDAKGRVAEKRSGVSSIDLAVVMQKTVCELLDRTGENGVRMPGYNWAGFTLNGFWRLPASFLPEFE